MSLYRKDRSTTARHIRPHYFLPEMRRRRQYHPRPPFRTTPSTPDFDAGCWFEAYGGAALEFRHIADRHEDDR